MKILEANVGALTNFEVLDFLLAKGASKDPSRVLAKVAMSEYKVYDYLVNTAAAYQTRESVNEYFRVIKQFELSEAEVLNVLNIRPASDVELFHIIEDCEERFPDEEVTDMVEKVKNTLPAPHDNEEAPEEITEGDEISQDETEGGEQMDTS